MAIRVTERRMDAKRRVTIPSTVSFKAGSKVVIVSSTDSAIIAPDTEIAEDIAKLLQGLESKKKQMALGKWEALIAGACLSDMSSEKIDQAVARKIKRRSDHENASEAIGNR
ncbi:MAG: hypothetical protein OK474_09605 [Thaumarchaeota archaeon]|nr:hypothetical protein [Nitrososphaerota archaeon]